jgi:hypothetical protein
MPSALKFAIRSLRRSLGFTLLAVSILTLGIGASVSLSRVLGAFALSSADSRSTHLFRHPAHAALGSRTGLLDACPARGNA